MQLCQYAGNYYHHFIYGHGTEKDQNYQKHSAWQKLAKPSWEQQMRNDDQQLILGWCSE